MKPGESRHNCRPAAAMWASAMLHLAVTAPAVPAQSPWVTAPGVSRPVIGALDPAERAALVFIGPGEAVFGVRIVTVYEGVRLAGRDVEDALIALGPRAPDGSYGELSWRLPRAIPVAALGASAPLPTSPPPDVLFRWGKQGDASAIATVEVSAPCEIVVEPYFPYGITANYDVSSTLRGIVAWSGTAADDVPACHFRLEADRRSRTPSIEEVAAGSGLNLRFPLAGGERLALRGQVGTKPIATFEVSPGAVDAALDGALARYQRRRILGEGAIAGAADAVASTLFHLVAYCPGSGSTYLTSRAPSNTAEANVSGPDAFLSALAASMQGKSLAYDIVYTLCETQLVNGCVPGFVGDDGAASNWSQPPLGSYCALKLHERFGDRALLEYAYPRLLRWYQWWTGGVGTGTPRRDGNADGLLEWGGNTMAEAKLESGMAGSPMWDGAGFNETTRTMALNAIDLNSFRALDAWCLSRMAEALERPMEAAVLAREYEAIKERINVSLWDDAEGMYLSRRWDGRFDRCKTPASFYPLLAGIPTKARADRMVRRLLDESEFWGRWMVPTISRADPTYDPAARWRGAVSPVANYILYEGLKRYGYDDAAAGLAQRSAKLLHRAPHTGGGWRAWYDASTGEGIGEPFQRHGALLPLMALQEMIDVGPWNGLRFGWLGPAGECCLRNVTVRGHRYAVETGARGTKLTRGDRLLFAADAPVVVREFGWGQDKAHARVRSSTGCRVRVAVPPGRRAVARIDGRSSRGAAARGRLAIPIPAGEHVLDVEFEPD